MVDPVKPSDAKASESNPTTSTTPKVSEDKVTSGPSLIGANVKPSDESVENNPSKVIGKTEKKYMTREDFLKEVADILRRYTSDTQSAQKAFAEIETLTNSL